MSDVLNHANNSPVARMAAGLQLKNALTSKDPEIRVKYQERWLQFPLDIRNYIKQNVSNMVSYLLPIVLINDLVALFILLKNTGYPFISYFILT